MRRVGHHLHGVFVPFRGVAHEGGSDFRLLNEVLGSAAAKIDHAAGGRVAGQMSGFEHIADHVKSELVLALIAIFGDPDADGGVADRPGNRGECPLCRRP